MRKTIFGFVFLLAGPAGAQVQLSGFNLHPQQTKSWCYAATTQMVGEFFGSSLQQCEIANHDNGLSDCCNAPIGDSTTDSSCINGGDTNATMEYWGFPSSQATGSVQFSTIQNQIDAHLPVQTSIAWTSSGGHHSIVVDGYWVKSDGSKHVHYVNPLPVNVGDEEWTTYSHYLTGGTTDDGSSISSYSIATTSYNLKWGPICPYDFANMDSSNYRECFDQRVHHNQWPSTLSSGDGKMAGNWHGSGNRPVSWNVSHDDLVNRANSLSGWRPDTITVNSDDAVYNCIWTAETHQWTTHFAEDAGSFIDDDNSLYGQGWVMKDIYGFNITGTPQFSGTWVKQSGTYVVDVGVSLTTFGNDDTSNRLAGYMLTRFSTYTDQNGNWRVAALWLPSTVNAYHYFVNQSPSAFQSNYDTYTGNGYKLVYTSMFGDGNTNAIYTK